MLLKKGAFPCQQNATFGAETTNTGIIAWNNKKKQEEDVV